MNQERPFEIMHLPSRLRGDFTGIILEAQSGTVEERERNFLTRALAAYAVNKLSGCTIQEAAQSIVDGGGDGGIDAIYYAPTSHSLWVVQSKFISEGRGEPALGEVTRFIAGLENLLLGNWAAFRQNPTFSSKIPQIQSIFNDASLQVKAILVYSGMNIVSDDRIRLFENLKRRFSPDSDYFSYSHFNLTSVHDWLTGADETIGVEEIDIAVQKPGWISTPYETIYGFIPISDVAALFARHGKRLIAANIRAFKGATEVNQEILHTLREEPESFFYLNNGLTAYCERLEVNNIDRGNIDQKRIKAYGFSIVNGAQTIGAIYEHNRRNRELPVASRVFIKIISLEQCPNETSFAQRISRSTNFQNQIIARDFVAIDEHQERIARGLSLSGIFYHYKDDADIPPPDTNNFSLDEATTALACLEQMNDCDFCVRCLSNRRSLWSIEEVYPTDLYKTRYHKIFRADRSSRTVWRAVQTQRIVIDRMRANASASTGIQKAFYENARWLILNIIFLQLHPELGEEMAFSADEMRIIGEKTIEYCDILWTISETLGYFTSYNVAHGAAVPYLQTRHFRSIFCDSADCRRLRNAVLSRLATDATAQTATTTTTGNTN